MKFNFKNLLMIGVAVTFMGGRANADGKSAISDAVAAGGLGLAGYGVLETQYAQSAESTCGNWTAAAACAFFVAGAAMGVKAIVDLTSKNSNNNTSGCQISAAGSSCEGPTGSTGDVTLGSLPPDIAAGIKDLQAKGITINPDGTATMPDGKTVGSGTFASPQSMADAGFTPSQVAQLPALQQQAADMVKKALQEGDGGGDGGAGTGAIAGGLDSSASVGDNGLNGKKVAPKINRDPAQIAGMSKNFHGQPIGVAGDSIFSMMNRRYQLHDQLGSFAQPTTSSK